MNCGHVICSFVISFLFLTGCSEREASDSMSSCSFARYFDISKDGTSVVTISPYDGSRDTIRVDGCMDNIICMSSSHVAALDAVGADSLITAVSGIRYISDPDLRRRYEGNGKALYDIGYEQSLDYERILSLHPGILVAYTVSGVEPPYIAKLRSLGVPVIVLHDHLEEHPLARAEYVRLFGTLAGCREMADSVFDAVRARYEALVRDTAVLTETKKVLLNVPYGDAWYVPGADSYMSRIIRDAGGEVLGASPGTSSSRVISLEQAYLLSKEADIWLNPGHCRSRDGLSSLHQFFPSFGPLAEDLPIYNNILRTTPEGGNDFWESGAMRPDLVLKDLKRIFRSESDSLTYFFPLM